MSKEIDSAGFGRVKFLAVLRPGGGWKEVDRLVVTNFRISGGDARDREQQGRPPERVPPKPESRTE